MNICSRFPIAQKVFRISLIIILISLIIKNLLILLEYSGVDLSNLVTSARIAAENNPYIIDFDSSPLIFMGKSFWVPINLNPPISLIFLAPIKSLDYKMILPYWRLASSIIYIISIGLLLILYPNKKTFLTIVWLMSIGVIWDCLGNGQIYMPLLLLCAISWILLSKYPILAGIFIGFFVAIKPPFIVWIILLILGKYLKAGLSSLITFLFLSTLPIFVFGIRIYDQYIRMILSGLTPPVSFTTNGSIMGFTSRLGITQVGVILSIILLLVLAFIAWHYKPDIYIISEFGLIGGFLASPISWITYDLFLLPIILSHKWNKTLLVAAILLTIPLVDIYHRSITSNLNLIFWGSIVFLIQFLILFEITRKFLNTQKLN